MGAEALQGPGEKALAALRLRGTRLVEGVLEQPARLHDPFPADDAGVAGVGGEGLVGREVVVGGTQGQNLPDTLARADQEIDEMVGLYAEIARGARPWKGGGMQQDPGEAAVEYGCMSAPHAWACPGRITPPICGLPLPVVKVWERYSGGTTPISW